MTNFKMMAHSIIFVLFSIIMTGCSSSDSSSSGSTSLQLLPETEFDYGTVTVGNSAAALEVIITNNGSVRLDISNIALSDTTNFTLDENAGSTPCATLSPALDMGISCTVEVSFDPQLEDVFAATLTITSNDAGSPKVLTLKAKSEVPNTLKVTINQVDTSACTTTGVVAYVSVTDQVDFPVAGLTENDFMVSDTATAIGMPSNADIVNLNHPISIALVMDNSSSMQPIDKVEMNDAANIIINQLVGSDMAEIIKFDKVVYTEQAFTIDKGLLKLAVAVDHLGTGTALYDALQKAIDDTALQTSKRKAVIAITDGLDSTDPAVSASLAEVIANGQAKGVPVFVIGLGVGVDLDKLGQIATGTSGELYEANVAQNLGTIIQKQLSEVLFDDQYILTYASASTGGGSGGTTNLTVDATSSALSLSGTHTREITACP